MQFLADQTAPSHSDLVASIVLLGGLLAFFIFLMFVAFRLRRQQWARFDQLLAHLSGIEQQLKRIAEAGHGPSKGV